MYTDQIRYLVSDHTFLYYMYSKDVGKGFDAYMYKNHNASERGLPVRQYTFVYKIYMNIKHKLAHCLSN